MKNSDEKKKVIFEPISVEEAKKVRATGSEKFFPPSGLECESGGDRYYDPCYGKHVNDWCCFHDYRDVYGKCNDREERLFCDPSLAPNNK